MGLGVAAVAEPSHHSVLCKLKTEVPIAVRLCPPSPGQCETNFKTILKLLQDNRKIVFAVSDIIMMSSVCVISLSSLFSCFQHWVYAPFSGNHTC